MQIVTALLTLGGLSLVLATILVIANRRLYVFEDPRIDEVEDLLPHANCGACGYPGCRPFAEALVAGSVQPAKCTVSSEIQREDIARYLGIEAGNEERRVARLACSGGSNVARERAFYAGIKNCQAASLVSGGGKSCFWGCLGFGDCKDVCDFDAISMSDHRLPEVDIDLCTACGDCVEICPKDLFSLEPVSQHLWVNCKNEDEGDQILEECQVACTACGRCAMDAKGGLITMTNGLPRIDYSAIHETIYPIQRCPTGAIVWWSDNEMIKGRESRRVIRKSPVPAAKT